MKDKLMKEAPDDMGSLSASAPVAAAKSGKLGEATDALMVLGYSRAEALAAIKDMDLSKMELEEIIRLSLKKLMKY